MGAPSISDKDFSATPEVAPVARDLNASQPGEESPVSYIGKSAVLGAANQMRRNIEGAYAPMGLPESLVRWFLPKEWADKAFPVGGIGDAPLEGKDAAGNPVKTTVRKLNAERAETAISQVKRGAAPGLLSETLGAGAEGFGSFAANPAGGPLKLIKGTMMALGAGMGAELGRKGGRSIGETVGDMWDQFSGGKGTGDKAGAVGEVAGSLAGGAGGANLNVLRGRLIGAGADAAKNALALRKADAQGSLAKNFKDNYSSMNAEAQGTLQQYVNNKLVETIQKNPQVESNVQEFDSAAARIGIDPKTYDLAQRTADPALLAAYESQRPRNLEEKQAIVQKDRIQKGSLVKAFDSADLGKSSPKTVVESLDDFQKVTNTKIAALEVVKKKAEDVVTSLTPDQKHSQGETLRSLYDAKMNEARPIRDSWYSAVKTADALDPKTYDLKEVEKDLRGVLDDTLVRMKPEVAPEALVKLDKLLKRAKGSSEVSERVKGENGVYRTEVTSPAVKAEDITTDDMTDIFKALNREVPKDRTEARNLQIVRDSLERAFEKQAPEAVRDAYRKAQTNYRTLYAPMFKEGVNNNLDRRASISRKGESYYSPDMGMEPYLNEKDLVTRMQQFDNLFGGGKIGARSEQAYQELGKAIENKYHQEMFGPGAKFTPAKHDQFMGRFDPVFQRVPGAKAKIEKQADQVFNLQGEQERERQQFREVTRSPLNQTIGKDKADALVGKALTDPGQMNRLIRAMAPHGGVDALLKDVTGRFNFYQKGQFDPLKMEQVLKDGEPGLKALFEAKLGSKGAADVQYQTLRDIATVAKRQALAEIKQQAPNERISHDPIRGATGSSGASIMSYFRSTSQGYTSVPYVGVLAGGRFLTQKLQNSLVDAEIRAFNDPDMARAILELHTKRIGEGMTGRTARKVFGASKELLSWLVDRGYVLQTSAKGAQLGVTAYGDEKKRESATSR